jgi:GR25 family glycosyltransferase involved in LPS biosynthesis
VSSLGEFRRVGLENKVVYYRPERDIRGGRIGCWLSHVACMQRALESGSHALIFEDDVKFIDGWDKSIGDIKKFLSEEPEWDIFRIGAFISSFESPSASTSNIWRAKCWNTHAILMNVEFMRRLLSSELVHHPENTHLHIDDYYHDTKEFSDFVLASPICYQKNDMGTDNHWFPSDTYQNIIQNKYLYEFFQMASNYIAWYLRWLPTGAQQYMNPFSLCVNLGTYINSIMS